MATDWSSVVVQFDLGFASFLISSYYGCNQDCLNITIVVILFGCSGMRAYILTNTERKLLERYLETEVKTSNLIVLLHRIRKNLPKLKEDIDLLSRALVHTPVKEKEKRRRALEQEKKEPRREEEIKGEQKKEITWHELIYGTK